LEAIGKCIDSTIAGVGQEEGAPIGRESKAAVETGSPLGSGAPNDEVLSGSDLAPERKAELVEEVSVIAQAPSGEDYRAEAGIVQLDEGGSSAAVEDCSLVVCEDFGEGDAR
jgi:hypothetical protein